MSGEFLSVLVVQVLGFLSLIVTTLATSNRASSERRDVAAAATRAAVEARDALILKTRLDDERAERDRRWAREDAAALSEKLGRDTAHLTSRIDGAIRTADRALLATNLGAGLDDEAPAPSRRLAALAAAGQVPQSNQAKG